MNPPRPFAYLHGFASGPTTWKGRHLRDAFARRGWVLHLPDLNVPSFADLTITNALAVVDRLVADLDLPDATRLGLLGSSFGGYLAARWAELHPERVDRLVLLCPGFDLLRRWPAILGADALERWRREGSLEFALPDGTRASVRSTFLDDAERHPPFPVLPCPTLLIHGTRDAIVPVETSRDVVRRQPTRATLLEIDDDHGLTGDLAAIERAVVGFLGGDGLP